MMGVQDSELVQRLITIAPSSSLDDVVQECYTHEATRNTASAITSPSTSCCATSQYKKTKNQSYKTKVKPPDPPCNSCSWAHSDKQCPASESVCRDCGKRGHWSKMARCPVRNAICRICGQEDHYDQCCAPTKSKFKPKGKQPQANSGSTQHHGNVGSTPGQRNKFIKRVSSASRTKTESPQQTRVTITHGNVSGYLSMIPNTGADVTLIGLNHLHHLGLSKQVLQPPPQAKRFTADGSEMSPPLGSFKANVTFADNATATWIDVHEILPTPLLSYRDCKDLAIISEDFPKPILEVTHANRLHETDVTSPACSPTTRPSTTPPPHTS